MYMFGLFHKTTFSLMILAFGINMMVHQFAQAQIKDPEVPDAPDVQVIPEVPLETPVPLKDIPSILKAPDPIDILPPKSLPEISDLLRDNKTLQDEILRNRGDDEEQGEALLDKEQGELTKKSAENDDEATSALPDYSQLTATEEREVRLDLLFERLGAEEDTELASIIAEDVWAIWLESGSATVNYILRRGTAAQKRGDAVLARRMFDHVTTLSPDYAEGWSRSARLALEEKDYNRAFGDVGQALIYEPRHFYALWTLGNVCEQLGLQAQALEAYKEAHRLYPELTAVKDRLGVMEQSVEGDVL